jgi:hypothetical protein
MCLITTSCSNEEDDDIIKAEIPSFTWNLVLRHGDYQGYWTVWNEKADSCVMTFDGSSLSFSKMPVGIILDVIDIYNSAGSLVEIDNQDLGHYAKNLSNDSIQIEEEPFVVNPVLTGYSVKTLYFTNNIDKASMDVQHKFLTNIGQAHLNPYMGYLFSVIVDDDKEWNYLLVFDQENYGVINILQSSLVIKLYLKEVYIQTPEGKIDHMSFDRKVELAFISND